MNTYGLIGYPLVHSYSQTFFNEKFGKENIDARYLNFEIKEVQELRGILENDKDIVGLNVTIPHKQTVIPLLDSLSEEAREIGAVNVIKVLQVQGQTYLKGYNSDVLGFARSISPLLKTHHKKALVLGTGGASKAVCYGLKLLGVEPARVSRTAGKGNFTYADLNEAVMSEYNVVINCTPLGTFPNTNGCPDIPYELLNEKHLLFDLVYNPDETLFLKRGKAQGATVKNGLEMLHLQALAAWELWNDKQYE